MSGENVTHRSPPHRRGGVSFVSSGTKHVATSQSSKNRHAADGHRGRHNITQRPTRSAAGRSNGRGCDDLSQRRRRCPSPIRARPRPGAARVALHRSGSCPYSTGRTICRRHHGRRLLGVGADKRGGNHPVRLRVWHLGVDLCAERSDHGRCPVLRAWCGLGGRRARRRLRRVRRFQRMARASR